MHVHKCVRIWHTRHTYTHNLKTYIHIIRLVYTLECWCQLKTHIHTCSYRLEKITFFLTDIYEHNTHIRMITCTLSAFTVLVSNWTSKHTYIHTYRLEKMHNTHMRMIIITLSAFTVLVSNWTSRLHTCAERESTSSRSWSTAACKYVCMCMYVYMYVTCS